MNLSAARSFLLLLAFSLTAVVAQAQQRYHVTDLGVIPGQQNSYAIRLNEQAQVAGYSERYASRYNNGVQENLGTLPGGLRSRGLAINNLGAVVGWSEYTNGGAIQHATLFQNGTTLDLGTLPNSGNYSHAVGINEKGEVVGYSGPNDSGPNSDPFPTSNTRAFIWDASNGMRDIGTLGGGFAKAYGINNSSVVTGTADSSEQVNFSHAFLWDATNGMRDIGAIDGPFSVGRAINENGHVAGTSTINNFDNRQHAFLYNGSTMIDLGSLGLFGAQYEGGDEFYSDRSSANGINIYDHVVGSTYLPYRGGALYQVAFIYRDGRMHNLEALLDSPNVAYRLGGASDINDKGQITATASRGPDNDIRGVLLTPIPQINSFSRADGVVSVQGRAQPNQSLRVEKSSSPGSFTPDSSTTIMAGADGTFQFAEAAPSGLPNCYYRVVAP